MENSIQGKFFVNSKTSIIQESLKGQCLTNEKLLYYPQYNFVIDSAQLESKDKVRLLCGGGSGHEPAHGGYVTKGMLTCAVCGDIFSSPACANIIKAVKKIYTDAGVIIIVKNYTGDIINFSLACELFKSQGKKVDMVIVDDDISLINMNEKKESNEFNKRRGLCGTVLLYKILGYLSEKKFSFEDMMTYARSIIPSLYTVGVSLTTCIPPFSSITKGDVIPNGFYELGLGIHGEKGLERIKFESVDDVIQKMFEKSFNAHIEKEIYSKMKDVVIIVNNLGALTPIEMNIIIKTLCDYVYRNTKLNIVRIIHGAVMTSLDMKGFSLTLCNLNQNDKVNESIQLIAEAIDAKVEVPSSNWNVIKEPKRIYDEYETKQILYDKEEERKEVNSDASKTKGILSELFALLKSKEEYLNTLDKKVGDGDIGTGTFNAVTKANEALKFLNFETELKSSLKRIAEHIGAGFGGTSGPLYMSFLLRGSDFIKEKESENTVKDFVKALNEGARMIMNVGKAKLGDRTMIDYLIPMSEQFEPCENIEQIKKVFNENRKELLEKVKHMKSKRGRSSYLDGKEIGLDEPGCVLVDLWMEFILSKINC